MGLDKTVIGLMAIKDLFSDTFAISKVLIIVPLRVAWYTWKEEISGWSHPDILKYSVLIGNEEERIKGVDIIPRTRLLRNIKIYPYWPLKPHGSYSVDTKDINLEILHFKQFYKHFVFEKDEEGYVKKTQKNYMDVRVVFGLVWENTKI